MAKRVVKANNGRILVEVLRRGVREPDIRAINALMDQLLADVKSKKHDCEELSRLDITRLQDVSTILVVRSNFILVGLGVFSVKSSLVRSVGWLDDLVVDEKHRRRGIGEALVRAMIEAGRIRGLERLNCTCRPEKEPANRLCLKVDFRLVGTVGSTNFYTFEYKDKRH